MGAGRRWPGEARRVLQGRARPRPVYVRAINGVWVGLRARVGLRAARILAGGCGAPSIFGHISSGQERPAGPKKARAKGS